MKKKSLEIRALEALVEKMDAQIVALEQENDALFHTKAILREICSPHVSEEIVVRELDLKIEEIEERPSEEIGEYSKTILAKLKEYRTAIVKEGLWQL